MTSVTTENMTTAEQATKEERRQLRSGAFYKSIGVVAVLLFSGMAVALGFWAPGLQGGPEDLAIRLCRIALWIGVGIVCAVSLAGIVIILSFGQRRDSSRNKTTTAH